MKYIISIVVLFIGLTGAFGQLVTYDGLISERGTEKRLSGVTVTVRSNGAVVSSATTGNNGRYSVQFPPGKEYTIEYSKAGLVSKLIKVDVAGVNVEDMPPGGKIFPPVNLDLFAEVPGVDLAFLKNEAVVEWYFDGERMNIDNRYVNRMKKKIDDRLANVDFTDGKDDEKYNQLIAEADSHYGKQEYEKALNKYVEAISVTGKQQEKHPNQRILEIEDLLQAKAQEDLIYQQENQEYFNLIAAADNFAQQKDYAKAIAKYEEALQVKSDEQYPKDQIRDLKNEQANAAKRDEYNALIQQADGFYKQNSIEAARDRYKAALKLFPTEEYPKAQLQKIDGELEALAEERNRQQNYNKAVEAADKLYDEEKYEEAIAKYEEALTYESAATYPKGRIGMANEILDEIRAEKEKQERFDKLVAEGDEENSQKKYEDAIAKYQEALTIKEDDGVQAKIKSAEAALAELLENAELQENFDKLVQEGDNEVGSENYANAIAKYEEALGLIENAEVRTKLQTAQNSLAEELAKAEKQEQFNSLVAEGDSENNQENYEAAISKYQAAIALFDDAEVRTKIEAAQNALAGKLADKEKQAQFTQLVQEGDSQRANEKFEEAIAKYQEALTLVDDDDVKAKIKSAEESLLAQKADAEKELQIESLLAAAVSDVLNKQYENALNNYNEVLTLDAQNVKAIEGKAEVEGLIAELKSLEALEGEFDGLVAKADADYNASKWESARDNYIAAKKIFNDREHVNSRIEEINALIRNAEDAERIAEEINTLLQQAEQFKPSNKWNDVILKYEEALGLDNSRTDVADLLAEARDSKAAWDAEQSAEDRFNSLKQGGDISMAREEWNEAKSKYEEALTIKEDSEIRTNLALIEENLEREAANKAKEENYRAKMAEGESFANNNDYEKAITSFEAALAIKADDVDAKARIQDMRDLIAGNEEAKEKAESYQAFMTEGRNHLNNEDYSAAIKSFDDALEVKPLDQEATTLKAQAMGKIQELRAEEEKYNALIASAGSDFDRGNQMQDELVLEGAKSKYEEAQAMRPNASEPQNRIVEINELLRQLREDKAVDVDKEYQEQIDKANIAANATRYEEAIGYLNAALGFKPNETYPKQKIAEYQALLAKMAGEKALEEQYASLIQQADSQFDNKSYEASITTYEAALKVKANESYPVSQIAKARKAIEALAEENKYRVYQNFIDQGDLSFSNEQYQNALGFYESALNEKAGDKYAQDKIDETKQILEELAKKSQENAQLQFVFQQHITSADKYFDAENYLKAKEEYEKALKVFPNDVYARERERLSVLRAKEATEQENERRYRQIVDKADEYFDSEDYDKAIGLYERAHTLRAYDRYPTDRLDEIRAILNSSVKQSAGLEDLGIPIKISILEGEALLADGERQRVNLKRERVDTELRRNEGIAQDLSDGDYRERVNYDNAIILIKDQRDRLNVDKAEEHRDFIEDIDQRLVSIEEIKSRKDNFELGDIQQAYKEIDFVLDDMDEVRSSKSQDHLETIEIIKVIQQERDNQNIAESAHHNVKVNSNELELVKVDDYNTHQLEVFKEEQRAKEVRIDDIERNRELRAFSDQSDNYQRVIQLEDDALLAELKVSESKGEKLVVQDRLRDDIYALDVALQRKMSEDSRQGYDDQLEIDVLLTRANEQYTKIQENKDDSRQLAVEQLKDLDQEWSEQARHRNEGEYQRNQESTSHIEVVKDIQSEQARKQEKDLVHVDNELKEYMISIDRQMAQRDLQETSERYSTVSSIERIEREESRSKQEKGQKITENYEDVKGLSASIEGLSDVKNEQLKNDRFRAQETITDLQENQRTTSPLIANTLGDDYPEGVSEESFVENDKDGIPVKIITRRVVVVEGRGEVYIRIQTRNGITYSKNGDPVTEQVWISGTENANLEKHY